MSLEVRIPSVGESISSGLLAQWHHQDGDRVKSGDVLLTLETDKVSSEITAEGSGVLKIEVPEGEEVEIGAVVARIEPAGDDDDHGDADETTGGSDKAEAQAGDGKPDAGASKESARGDDSDADERTGGDDQPPSGGGERKTPAPAPVLRAVEREADASDSAAEAAATATAEAGQRSAATGAPASQGDRVTRRRMSPLRRKIADHLVNAQQTAAILTTFNECDMSAVMALRKQLQEDFVSRHGVKLGFMSMFIKAVVDALKAVPQVNVQVQGDEILHQHYYDIGVAVGTERGLIVPVVRDCDRKTFAELEQELADLAVRAREGRIGIDDLRGGVFTISNGGVYGSLLSTPILNPPQSGILGMHAIQPRPVAVDGKVEIRPMMYLALSYDHRVVDGKEAVTFLVRVKQCLENPTRLLIGA